ncbi:hypothetical protein SEPCBS57363_003236 [Sporothrix epigloea]|uniref:HPP transmembrane region domain-containing protein n=1 Tax=Sporothrix epigloea TaxID=1892477 RepID=A0ABP0DP07_9PEZI
MARRSRPPIRSAAAWELNVDAHLNQFIPPSFVPYLPWPLAHFLGYRPPAHSKCKIGNLVVIAWAFIGVFCGVSVVNVVGAHVSVFRGVNGAETTIGSFGAAAVLEFYAIESPLAQPRNAVLGQVVSSIVGVSVAKLFSLLSAARFEALRWLAASLACAAATATMALTGTVHPPAGATALLAVTDGNAYHIGWWLVPAVLLGSVLMQVIALLVNNLQRRYPMYWWSPESVGQFWKQGMGSILTRLTIKSEEDEEKAAPHVDKCLEDSSPVTGHVTFTRTPSSCQQLTTMGAQEDECVHEHLRVTITRNAVVVPDSLFLRPEEKLMLEALSERL